MNRSENMWLRFFLMGFWLLSGCGQLEVGIEASLQAEPLATTAEADGGALAMPTRAAGTPTLRPAVLPTAVSSSTATPTPTGEPSPTGRATLLPPPAATNTVAPSATHEPPPEIYQISVLPEAVAPGAQLQVSWEAFGAHAEICVFQDGYTGYRECRETAVSGTLTWELDEAVRDDFAVALTVSRGEQVAVREVPMTVTCVPAAAWWFFTPAPAGCPGADAVTTQAAVQQFERGWMLWLETEDVIYAFFDDNTYAQFDGYQLWGDTESGDGGVIAPAGLVAPVRGFGLVWRGEAEGAENGWVRAKIGWGLTAESGFQTRYQWDTHVDSRGIYVRDAEGRIIYLDPAPASWSVYQPQEPVGEAKMGR